MDKFLDTVFLDNKIRDYLLVVSVFLLVFILKRFLSRYFAGLLFRIVNKISTGVDKKSFVSLIVSPLETFLLVLVTVLSLYKLTFPKVLNVQLYKVSMQALMESASIIILIITFIWLLLRIIDFIAIILHQKANLTPDTTDNQLIVFFKDFFKVLIVINGILLILKFGFQLRIGNLITALSIGGAAIALSLRESMENLIASFIIFFDKPFMVGDTIKVQHVTGIVEKIGLRSTRIRTDQKTFVTVPNKQMVDNIMDNLSLRTQRRSFVALELNSESSPEQVKQLVLGIEHIIQDRRAIENHNVFLADISKNAFVVNIEFFTGPIPVADFNKIRQEINLAVMKEMENLQLRLASKENEPSTQS
jgi:MscS family membrane protein